MDAEQRVAERAKRRAYCDGYQEALESVMYLIPDGSLAALAQHGRAVYAAYTACMRHLEGPLQEWRNGPCNSEELPPEVGEVAPLPRAPGEDDGGDVDELSGELGVGELAELGAIDGDLDFEE